jgi:hypothetical protein
MVSTAWTSPFVGLSATLKTRSLNVETALSVETGVRSSAA